MRKQITSASVAAVIAASVGGVLAGGQTQAPAAPRPTAPAARPAAPATRPAAPAAARPALKPNYQRMPDGKPDLQGVYDTATITPLERRAAADANMTEEQAKRAEDATAARKELGNRPSNGARQAPPVGGDGSTGAAGNVGGYNGFWIDSGDKVVVIDSKPRSSIIVDPPSGCIPLPIGRAARGGGGRGGCPQPAPVARGAVTSDAPEDEVSSARDAYDNPEQRPLGERCLLGFGSTSGPPALPVLYNNFKQIVQTPTHVMILTEMNHDARIVRMNQPHRPSHIRMWNGDPIGRWEGDTLVVETTNFTEKTRYRGSSPDLKVTERFSRLDDKTLLYRFTVEDPATWAQPWSGEYTWRLADADDHLYEYACHEGNYALSGILKGERLLEKEAEEAARQR